MPNPSSASLLLSWCRKKMIRSVAYARGEGANVNFNTKFIKLINEIKSILTQKQTQINFKYVETVSYKLNKKLFIQKKNKL